MLQIILEQVCLSTHVSDVSNFKDQMESDRSREKNNKNINPMNKTFRQN